MSSEFPDGTLELAAKLLPDDKPKELCNNNVSKVDCGYNIQIETKEIIVATKPVVCTSDCEAKSIPTETEEKNNDNTEEGQAEVPIPSPSETKTETVADSSAKGSTENQIPTEVNEKGTNEAKDVQDTASSVTNLFVNYLPVRAGDDTLYALFSPYGEIESCKVMIDLQTGQSRCFGFVKYKEKGCAPKAISSLHGHKIDNKSLVVKPANSSSDSTTKGIPSNNLYIKGIPLSVTEEYISQLFSPYGAITEVKILTNPATGVNRGVGFIRFNTTEEAAQAIKALHGVPITGSAEPLVVKYADTPGSKQTSTRATRTRITAPRFTPYPQVPVVPYPGYFPGVPPGYPIPQMTPPGYFPSMVPHQTMPGGMQFVPPAHLERNLFVYHLPQNADDTLLYRLFSPFGAIESAKAVIDSAGLCKGFGFVKMINHPDAVRAIQMMNGVQVGNKYLQVSFKK